MLFWESRWWTFLPEWNLDSGHLEVWIFCGGFRRRKHSVKQRQKLSQSQTKSRVIPKMSGLFPNLLDQAYKPHNIIPSAYKFTFHLHSLPSPSPSSTPSPLSLTSPPSQTSSSTTTTALTAPPSHPSLSTTFTSDSSLSLFSAYLFRVRITGPLLTKRSTHIKLYYKNVEGLDRFCCCFYHGVEIARFPIGREVEEWVDMGRGRGWVDLLFKRKKEEGKGGSAKSERGSVGNLNTPGNTPGSASKSKENLPNQSEGEVKQSDLVEVKISLDDCQ